MRKNKKPKFMALWIALIVTGVLFAGLGCYLKYAVCKPLNLFQDQSAITVPFVLMSQKGRNQYKAKLEASQKPDPTAPVTEPPTEPQPTAEAPTEAPTTPTAPETEPPTEPQPLFEVPVYGEDESYFDDVLFIGDSRTVGLRDYCRLGDADYFCNVGMSVLSLWGETAADEDFGEVTLSELLSMNSYGKIYVSLGINECGYPLDMLMESFQELVDRLQEAQPDAVIVLSSIMTVGRDKAASASHFSPDNLELINVALSGLADGETVFYLDVNEAFADEEGYLPSELSDDGVHLYANSYSIWSQWLCDSVEQLNEQFDS